MAYRWANSAGIKIRGWYRTFRPRAYAFATKPWSRTGRVLAGAGLAILSTLAMKFDFAPLAKSGRESHDVIERLSANPSARDSDLSIVYVNIDDITYRNWGRKSVTPRKNLVDLLSCVSSGNPESIVLDIALDSDGHEPDAEMLQAFLSGYGLSEPSSVDKPENSRCQAPWGAPRETANLPPIIMVLSTEKRINALEGTVGTVAECGGDVVNEDRRESEFYALVKTDKTKRGNDDSKPREKPPRLALAVSAICQDDDRIIRDWMLWDELGRQSDPSELLVLGGSPSYSAERFPSVGLLVNAIHAAGPDTPLETVVGDLKACLIALDDDCEVAGGKYTFDASKAARTQRLLYTIDANSEAEPQTVHTENSRVHVIDVIGADLAAKTVPSDDFYRDRVVIIGSSFLESGDIHGSPLGEMPGSYIIANTILALGEYGQIAPISSAVISTLAFFVLAGPLLLILYRARRPVMLGFLCSAILLFAGLRLRYLGISIDFLAVGFFGLLTSIGLELRDEICGRNSSDTKER